MQQTVLVIANKNKVKKLVETHASKNNHKSIKV